MLAWDVAQFVDLAGVMRGAAEVRAVAPTIAVLALKEWPAVFHIMVVTVTPGAVEGVMAGAVSPGVIKVIAGVVDLIVGHVGKGWHAVDDTGGDAVVSVGVGQGLGTLKALLSDVSQILS